MKAIVIVVAIFLGLVSLVLVVGAVIYGLWAPIDSNSQTLRQNEKEVYKELVDILVMKEKEKT